jgi:hypothetical protein
MADKYTVPPTPEAAMANFVIPPLWVVEYSHSQGTFNVQNLHEAVQDNQLAFLEGRMSDYAIVALADSYAQASAIRKVLDVRDDRTVPLDPAMAQHIMKQVTKVYTEPMPDAGHDEYEDEDRH